MQLDDTKNASLVSCDFLGFPGIRLIRCRRGLQIHRETPLYSLGLSLLHLLC